jgi:hypothetical protein
MRATTRREKQAKQQLSVNELLDELLGELLHEPLQSSRAQSGPADRPQEPIKEFSVRAHGLRRQDKHSGTGGSMRSCNEEYAEFTF